MKILIKILLIALIVIGALFALDNIDASAYFEPEPIHNGSTELQPAIVNLQASPIATPFTPYQSTQIKVAPMVAQPSLAAVN